MKRLFLFLPILFTVFHLNAQCTANFSWGDSTFFVLFDASTSTGTNLTYYWDFDDGNFDTTTNSSVTSYYSNPGVYYACLTVDDGAGCTNTYCDSVYFQSNAGPCSASFNMYDSLETVYFWSFPSGTPPYTYYWDIHDSTSSITTYTVQNPVHQFTATGTFYIDLHFMDSTGCAKIISDSIFIPTAYNTCQSGFDWGIDSSGSSNNVWIVNTAYGNNLSYLWDFGDGSTSTSPWPSHTYTQNGLYEVCLSIDNGAGCTDTYCDTIEYTTRQSGFTVDVYPMSGANDVLSISEKSVESFFIYPNPVSDLLNISLKNKMSDPLSISVYSIAGELVYFQKAQTNRGMNSIQLNTSYLPSGMYILQISGRNTLMNKRFIKH